MQKIPLIADQSGAYSIRDGDLWIGPLKHGQSVFSNTASVNGGWPIFAVKDDSGTYYIYVVYFLSSYVARWQVRSDGILHNYTSAHDVEPENLTAAARAYLGEAEATYLVNRCITREIDPTLYDPETFSDARLAAELSILKSVRTDPDSFEDKCSDALALVIRQRLLEVVVGATDTFQIKGEPERSSGEIAGLKAMKAVRARGYFTALNQSIRKKPSGDREFWWPGSPLRSEISVEGFTRDLGVAETEILVEPRSDGGTQTTRIKVWLPEPQPSESIILIEGKLHRIRSVLRYWIPVLTEKVLKTQKSYRMRISCRDSGSENMLSMDHNRPETPLFPDLYTLNASRLAHYDVDPDAFKEEFLSRKDILFWRGSTTGQRIESEDDLFDNLRFKACVTLREQLGVRADVRISAVRNTAPAFVHEANRLVRDHDVYASPVGEERFADFRYYVDLPGVANAWGTIRKYLNGIIVLKPKHHRHLYYYRYLEPWVNYVPLERWLGDAREVIDKLSNDPDLAASIAYNGRQMALKYLRSVPEVLGALADEHAQIE